MKHKNLQILSDHGVNVPAFTVLTEDAVRAGGNIDLSFSKAERFAVRSSFSLEDGGTDSFAGQFTTLLNVERANVPKAVQTVLSAAHSADAYRSARGIAAGGEMTVILQEMVNARLSGVIFTANPIGILNQTVITVGAGLGCGVVEDKVPTTTYFYHTDDDLYTYDRQDGAPLLPQTLLRELLAVAKKIKAIFNYEADVEFAVEGEQIYVLQTRPITTLPDCPPIVLDNSNIVESYPGVSLPLTQDFVRSVYYGIFRSLIGRITRNPKIADGMDGTLIHMTDVANWRIYYRISNWYGVLKLLPFSQKIISIWQEMLGVSNIAVPADCGPKVPLRVKLAVLRSFLHYLRHAPRYMDQLNARFAADFDSYCQQVEECTSPAELLAIYEQIKTGILTDWDLTLVNDMYTFIHTAMAGKKNRALLADVKNLESMKPIAALNELVAVAKTCGMNSTQYYSAAEDYIRLYGDRCLCELKLETETYRTDPHRLHEAVAARLEQPLPSPSSSAGEAKDRNSHVRKAKLGIRNREISRLNRSRLFGLSRRIFRRIGEFLVANGQLDELRDVFYLHMDELLSADDLRATITARKEQEILYRQLPEFSRLVFADRVVDHPVFSAFEVPLNRPDQLHGIASSAGKVVGEVLVIHAAHEQIDTTGKILVTRSTDPGWVFLIQNAAGIIAEKGSLLSHTAIIARELHKPAVVNVQDCTRILQTGDRVELNAYDGTVTILKE
ncbi:MAG: phosphoenolpyruvate synthase [Clostridia bacterium]|nr:phosphoenolpyruvate synthase [Clostridia bacterium]